MKFVSRFLLIFVCISIDNATAQWVQDVGDGIGEPVSEYIRPSVAKTYPAAVPGVWIGAKTGLFNINPNIKDSKGYADFEWFRVE